MSKATIDVSRDIEKILFGGSFARVQNGLGVERLFVFKQPSLKDRNLIEFIYNEALNEAIQCGLPSELELRHIFKHKGMWDETKDEKIAELTARMEELDERRIEATTKRQKRLLEKSMESVVEKLEDLSALRAELLGNSCEKMAKRARQSALIFASTYTYDDEKYWKHWSDFQQEVDSRLIENLTNEYVRTEYVAGKRIRFIARSGEWRMQWNAGKSIGDLFGKPIVELDSYQQTLVYWSQVYDNVYESMERPDDSVIEDDDALDEWFEEQGRKRKVKNIEDGGKIGKVNLSKSISRHGEIFVVTNREINPNAPTEEEVENLNTPFTKKFKEAERDAIKKRGSINEKDLRARNNKTARMLIGSKDAVITKTGMGGQARGGKGSSTIMPGGSI